MCPSPVRVCLSAMCLPCCPLEAHFPLAMAPDNTEAEF